MLTLPDISDTIITKTSTDELENKTLINPIIENINITDDRIITSSMNIISIPNYTDTLITKKSEDILENKTLIEPIITRLRKNNITTNYLKIPDISDTIVGLDSDQILTNKTLKEPIITSIKNGGIINIPNITDTLITKKSIDNLENKTLIEPIIEKIKINNNLLTLPDITDILVGLNSNQVLKNKILDKPLIKQILTETNKLINIPDNNDTIILQYLDQNIYNKKITNIEINNLTMNDNYINLNNNILNIPFININETIILEKSYQNIENKTLIEPIIEKIKTQSNKIINILDDTGEIILNNSNQTLSNKTLIEPIIEKIKINNNLLTLPDLTDDLVSSTSINTLLNKTLYTPKINNIKSFNNNIITIPDISDILVTKTSVDTLLNKTLISPSLQNNITLDGNININNLIDISNNVIINMDLILNNDLILNGNVNINNYIDISNNIININKPLYINNNLYFPSNQYIDNNTVLVDLNTNQELINKTLIQPIISSIKPSISNIISIPNITDTIVTLEYNQTLKNKKLINPELVNPNVSGNILISNNLTVNGNSIINNITTNDIILPEGRITDIINNLPQYNKENVFTKLTTFNNKINLADNLIVNSIEISPSILSYLNGLTGNIQNQINILPTKNTSNIFSGINTFNNNLHINSNIITNNKTITKDQLSYLSTTTSDIQTQLNNKANLNNNNNVFNNINTFNKKIILNDNIECNNNIITPIELSRLTNIKSNIQTQFDNLLNDLNDLSINSNLQIDKLLNKVYYYTDNVTLNNYNQTSIFTISSNKTCILPNPIDNKYSTITIINDTNSTDILTISNNEILQPQQQLSLISDGEIWIITNKFINTSESSGNSLSLYKYVMSEEYYENQEYLSTDDFIYFDKTLQSLGNDVTKNDRFFTLTKGKTYEIIFNSSCNSESDIYSIFTLSKPDLTDISDITNSMNFTLNGGNNTYIINLIDSTYDLTFGVRISACFEQFKLGIKIDDIYILPSLIIKSIDNMVTNSSLTNSLNNTNSWVTYTSNIQGYTTNPIASTTKITKCIYYINNKNLYIKYKISNENSTLGSSNGLGIYLFNLPPEIYLSNLNNFIDYQTELFETHNKLTTIGNGYYGYSNTTNINCFIHVKNNIPYIIILLNNNFASNTNGEFNNSNMLYNFECVIPLN